MWPAVHEYLILIFERARTYFFAFGPVAIDRSVQWLIPRYRMWASKHGPWRQVVVYGVILTGFLLIPFEAFRTEYGAHQASDKHANAYLKTIQGEDGTGGLEHDVAELKGQIAAKEQELTAEKSAKVRTQYVQIPPPTLQLHIDSSGTPYVH